MKGFSTIILPWAALVTLVAGQGFVPPPKNVTTVISERFPGAEISYKETTMCETTKGVKSYSGYVTLPKSLLEDSHGWDDDHAAHLFFWYFESRKNPESAPTAIRLGGGPGASSFDFATNFPCNVNPDSNSTTLNDLSWNNNVNMLYVDQPVGTGFSYVSLRNGTMDLINYTFTAVEDGNGVNDDQLNLTTVRATLDQSLQQEEFVNMALVPRTALSAARTMWNFVQVWFNEFPMRRTTNDEINLWTSSYGGFWGPAIFKHFLDQNELITAGCPLLANATILHLGTLGLSEACIDSKAIGKGYPIFARNNTYGIELYPDEVFTRMMDLIEEPDEGCFALIDKCRALVKEGDSRRFGLNETVNAACAAATGRCFGEVQGAYANFTTRAPFDITMNDFVKVPPMYELAFFNQRWVQEELGVPLNYTSSSNTIVAVFLTVTGDPMVGDISTLESVLSRGVNVAIASGDRDYRCNWIGAENVSLAMNFPSSDSFRAAGYAPLTTNSSYQGGLVREHGNLSFSRIFQAGHSVSAYQPETMYRVFERALSRRDVATGEILLSHNTSYATDGPLDVMDILNEVPQPEMSLCYLYGADISCTEEQLEALADGTAVVEDFVVVQPAGTKDMI
ncbi:hypothetical protein NM208_g6987 [Fusarium decemcellulare]|uniref:Uncharacterized protein n=1 Tax=Fusarium decemcellulare TaxID=57161 RepID=A0ACC1SAY0_9HYPO|nr:hypothetical protein NM208_g6987 [Fusarium decemcellulare]